ncbi:hypothetical protein HDU97_008438 [Phlyctochytrium planicorne]|nr:hypothetical protein HDU97_008438 [Phlyctochytrium planicorne]
MVFEMGRPPDLDDSHPSIANTARYHRQQQAETAEEYESEYYRDGYIDAAAGRTERENHNKEDEDALLRYRLAQLGYREDFPNGAIPLIRRLFHDMVMTTETARKFKHQMERVQSERAGMEEQVQPLRKEISKLTNENNRVHIESIRLSEDRDAFARRSQQLARKTENEIGDLRFMNTQYAQRLSAEQKRGEDERRRVEEAFLKMGLIFNHDTSDVVTAAGTIAGAKGGNKKGEKRSEKLYQRLQKIDLETGLEPMTESYAQFHPPNPATVDLLNVAQGKIDVLEKAAEDFKGKNVDLENEIQTLKDQLTLREQEIVRLGTQLEISRAQQFSSIQVSGKPVGVVRGDGAPIDPAESIHLLPVARERIEQLEQQVEHLLEQIDSLEKERAQAETDKDEHVLQVDAEKKNMEEELRKERQRNAGLIRSMSKLENMLAEYNAMDLDGASNPSIAASPRASPSASIRVTAQMLQSLLTEKTDRVKVLEKMSKLEKDLHEENVAKQKSLRSSMDELQRQNSQLRIDIERVQQKKTSDSQPESQLQEVIRANSELKSENSQLSQKRASALRFVMLWNPEVNSLSERDQLIMAIQRIEIQIDDMQGSINVISSDRDNLAMMYEQVEPVQHLPKTYISSSLKARKESATNTDNGMLAELERLRNSESTFLDRIHDLTEEIGKLQSDLKGTSMRQREIGEVGAEDVRRFEKEKERLVNALEKSEQEVERLRGEVERLQNEIEKESGKRSSVEKEISKLRGELEEARSGRDKDRNSTEDIRRRLEESQRGAEAMRVEMDRLRKECYELTTKNSMQKELMIKVDHDRDTYRIELDAKAEKIYELEERSRQLTATNVELQTTSAHLRSQLDATFKAMSDHEKTILGLQRQVERMGEDIRRLEAKLEELDEENKGLKGDLGASLRESRVLSGEVMEAVAERDRLREDVKVCDKEIASLNEVISTKEREREQIFIAYRKLIAEHDRLEVAYKSGVEDVNTLRMEVVLRDKRIVKLQKEAEETGKEISAMKVDLVAFERECSSLTRTIATYERNARHFESERARLGRDASVAQELASTFDRNREELQKRLGGLMVENERLLKQLSNSDMERDVLRNQAQDDKNKREHLEGLIASERAQRIKLERLKAELEEKIAALELRIAALNGYRNEGVALAKKAWLQSEEERKGNSSDEKIFEEKVDKRPGSLHQSPNSASDEQPQYVHNMGARIDQELAKIHVDVEKMDEEISALQEKNDS